MLHHTMDSTMDYNSDDHYSELQPTLTHLGRRPSADQGYDQGYQKGYAQGYHDGYILHMNKFCAQACEQDCFDQGYDTGYSQGYCHGDDRYWADWQSLQKTNFTQDVVQEENPVNPLDDPPVNLDPHPDDPYLFYDGNDWILVDPTAMVDPPTSITESGSLCFVEKQTTSYVAPGELMNGNALVQTFQRLITPLATPLPVIH